MQPYYILELLITLNDGMAVKAFEQYYYQLDSACLAAAAHHNYKLRLWKVTVTNANGRLREQRQRLMPEVFV